MTLLDVFVYTVFVAIHTYTIIHVCSVLHLKMGLKPAFGAEHAIPISTKEEVPWCRGSTEDSQYCYIPCFTITNNEQRKEQSWSVVN